MAVAARGRGCLWPPVAVAARGRPWPLVADRGRPSARCRILWKLLNFFLIDTRPLRNRDSKFLIDGFLKHGPRFKRCLGKIDVFFSTFFVSLWECLWGGPRVALGSLALGEGGRREPG